MITSGFSLAFNGSALLSNQNEMKWDRTIFQLTTNHCTSNVTSGFSGDTASLTPNPAWNEKFSGYSITGATLTGNTFTFTNSDVTVKANYETAKNVTTTTDGHGTITASPKSGFIGTQVTLTNTPNANYGFSGYSITGATLTGNKFNLTGSNVTAKATFSALPVTGSASTDGISYTKMVMIPLASSNGRNAQACYEDNGLGTDIGINTGEFLQGSYDVFSTYKSIYSSTKPIKVSAQTITGEFSISGFYNTTATATWGFRLAGMKPIYYDIFGTATLAGYEFTGFGNSYTRDYDGRDTWTAKDFYHTKWLYDAARDRKLLTAEIPAGYIPVIIECYVGGNVGNTTIRGSGAPKYDWSFTAEI